MDLSSLLQKLKPILGDEETNRIWEQLQLANPKTAKLIEFSLRRKLAKATGSSFEEKEILLDPIPLEKSQGRIPIGMVHYGSQPFHPFALRPGELIQHTAIFGRSGAGKTNTAFLLLKELSRQGIPFLVFDWKKNYRDLQNIHEFQDLVVYTLGRDQAPFFFNPLIPPKGINPQEWLKKLIEILQHAYFLGEGVAYVYQEMLNNLYREFGVYEGSGQWPNFQDLLSKLRAKPVKGREAGWMESALRAVGVLCFGAMDRVLNSGAYFPLEAVLRQNAVLELDALTNSDKTFLIESLLLWIHHHRMREPVRERLKHVLLIEEAHHILLGKKQELTGAEAVTDVILREVREFGEAIVLLDQLPSLISKPALENTYTTICMNLKEKGDVTAASKAMLLETDQSKYLGRLPVGWGIVKLQARWPKPFLVKFPLFSICKGVVTDEQVRDRFLQNLKVETAARLMKQSVESTARLSKKTNLKAVTAQNIQNKLHYEELKFLADVHKYPTSPVTERYSRLDLSPKKGTRLVSDLIKQGFLKSSIVPIRGSHIRFLELSSEGLIVMGLLEKKTNRFGGPEHRYWVESIFIRLKDSGSKVEKEVPVGGGKTIDILVNLGRRRIGIEVETGKSEWKANVRKCQDAGLDEIIMAATRVEVYNKIKAEIDTLECPSSFHIAQAAELADKLPDFLLKGKQSRF